MIHSYRYQPPASWADLENIVCPIARVQFGPELDVQRLGRNGQRQSGIDVYLVDREDRKIGIQCRWKDKSRLTPNNVAEATLDAENYPEKLDIFIIATTDPSDTKVQQHAAGLTLHGRANRVQVWSWDYLETQIEDTGLAPQYLKRIPSTILLETVRQQTGVLFRLGDAAALGSEMDSDRTLDPRVSTAAKLLRQGQAAAAVAVLTDFVPDRAVDRVARARLLARYALLVGRSDDALALLRPLDGDDSEALALQAYALGFASRVEDSREVLGLALKFKPTAIAWALILRLRTGVYGQSLVEAEADVPIDAQSVATYRLARAECGLASGEAARDVLARFETLEDNEDVPAWSVDRGIGLCCLKLALDLLPVGLLELQGDVGASELVRAEERLARAVAGLGDPAFGTMRGQARAYLGLAHASRGDLAASVECMALALTEAPDDAQVQQIAFQFALSRQRLELVSALADKPYDDPVLELLACQVLVYRNESHSALVRLEALLVRNDIEQPLAAAARAEHFELTWRAAPDAETLATRARALQQQVDPLRELTGILDLAREPAAAAARTVVIEVATAVGTGPCSALAKAALARGLLDLEAEIEAERVLDTLSETDLRATRGLDPSLAVLVIECAIRRARLNRASILLAEVRLAYPKLARLERLDLALSEALGDLEAVWNGLANLLPHSPRPLQLLQFAELSAELGRRTAASRQLVIEAVSVLGQGPSDTVVLASALSHVGAETEAAELIKRHVLTYGASAELAAPALWATRNLPKFADPKRVGVDCVVHLSNDNGETRQFWVAEHGPAALGPYLRLAPTAPAIVGLLGLEVGQRVALLLGGYTKTQWRVDRIGATFPVVMQQLFDHAQALGAGASGLESIGGDTLDQTVADMTQRAQQRREEITAGLAVAMRKHAPIVMLARSFHCSPRQFTSAIDTTLYRPQSDVGNREHFARGVEWLSTYDGPLLLDPLAIVIIAQLGAADLLKRCGHKLQILPATVAMLHVWASQERDAFDSFGFAAVRADGALEFCRYTDADRARVAAFWHSVFVFVERDCEVLQGEFGDDFFADEFLALTAHTNAASAMTLSVARARNVPVLVDDLRWRMIADLAGVRSFSLQGVFSTACDRGRLSYAQRAPIYGRLACMGWAWVYFAGVDFFHLACDLTAAGSANLTAALAMLRHTDPVAGLSVVATCAIELAQTPQTKRISLWRFIKLALRELAHTPAPIRRQFASKIARLFPGRRWRWLLRRVSRWSQKGGAVKL